MYYNNSWSNMTYEKFLFLLGLYLINFSDNPHMSTAEKDE